MKNKILRLLFLPFALIKSLFKIANDEARNMVNSRRYPKAFIHDGCNITDDTTIGENTSLHGPSYYNHCTIGSYSYISRNCIIEHASIGNYCSIAPDVTIGLGAHPLDMLSTSPIFYTNKNVMRVKILEKEKDFKKYEKINIGNDVWIGARAIIMNNITIGNGAVIAAGAVVTKDVPAYAIVAGVPAKIIRYRNMENFSEALNSDWWNLKPADVIKRYKIEY